MQESLTVMTRKGQITVPAEIRRALGLKRGDKVALSVTDADKREVTLRPAQSVAERTFGALKSDRPPGDLKELRRLFMEGTAEDVMAETSSASSEVTGGDVR